MSAKLWAPYFVPAGKDPYKLVTWKKFDCEIKDSGGGSVFVMSSVEAPASWSQLAVEIAASKYFRKVDVPKTKSEKSVKQMISRVVKAIVKAGVTQKVFSNKKQAEIFGKELTYILLTQRASFNSPVWFNCGLYDSYKIKGESSLWAWDFKKRKATLIKGAYVRPQVSACFIQKIEDNLDSIFNLVKNEAKLFKFGSGSGTNFSSLRSKYEMLSGGGQSSGLISFLEVLDRGAGSIKSGGTTRRAAKMVSLDVDHPEIEDFVTWKAGEEKKAQALIAAGYSPDFEGEAYKTVSGQNANNSVRVSDQFMKAVVADKTWDLQARTSKKVIKTIKAGDLWDKIIQSAWECADPGLQFDDTIQKWHTCAKTDKIFASNPCSEYMFLDDSACNLASLNLISFLNPDGSFDLLSYLHVAKIMFTAQEILVDLAGYPTEVIAENSHKFRPLGLGFAGLGALLMRMGIAYDSDEGRAWAGALTALLHGTALKTSSELAKILKPFDGYKENKTSMQKVIAQHFSSVEEIDFKLLPQAFEMMTKDLWNVVMILGKKQGFRNSQVTVMAPTGTIGLVMDCDTTGVEPEFSLVKIKKLAGGGQKIISSTSVSRALIALGYNSEEQIKILLHLEQESEIENAPGLKPEHVAIFDCAQKNGNGKRFLSADAHLKMMAAIQPFLSGAISKTVNVPHEATLQDISEIYKKAWRWGLKAIAIYRDGSKMSQPLSAKTSKAKTVEKQDYNLKCPECGGKTELIGGCFRCSNCGFTTGCVS